MIAHVVPVLRLRRATTWWSYKIPARMTCVPGSLVSIPFRGKHILGVVWETSQNGDDAKESIHSVYTHTPLIRLPSRLFIEWLSEAGCTSLSTALYVWLPSALRKQQLTRDTRTVLENYDTWQEALNSNASPRQHLLLVPGHRPRVQAYFASKNADTFADTLSPRTEKQEFSQWIRIATGEMTVVYGRERALFSPFVNLHEIIVQETEDVSYHHEQTPYLSLVEAANLLASFSSAQYKPRSWLLPNTAKLLWGNTVQSSSKPWGQLVVHDLIHDSLLNSDLVDQVRQTLSARKTVAILYNAHDRRYATENNEEVLLPGSESLRKKLVRQLGFEPGKDLIFNTRALLHDPPQNVGLAVVLTIDSLLSQAVFADSVHGWADINQMATLGPKIIIQTRLKDHPFILSLRNGTFDTYCMDMVKRRQQLGLTPFGTTYACSVDLGKKPKDIQLKLGVWEPIAHLLVANLVKGFPEESEWKCSHPLTATARGTSLLSVLLHTSRDKARLPSSVYRQLASLKKPWKVHRNPWYLL